MIANSKQQKRMPAKKRNEPKYKPFVGRLFSLRKHKKIFVSRDGANTNKRFAVSSEDLGQAVLVLDETNSRAKICDSSGRSVWISKFYLHKELVGNVFEHVDNLSKVLHKMLEISENIRETLAQYPETDLPIKSNLEQQVTNLQNLATSLRQIIDKHNPVTKSSEE